MSSTFRVLLLIACTGLFTTIRSQSVHPTQGIQLGNPRAGIDIVFPASITQCESFLVYYNITVPVSPFIAFYTPDLAGDALLTLHPPGSATGYIDWVCDIPAGHGLIVGVRDLPSIPGGVLRTQNYVVRSGATSSCLVDLTREYSVLQYGTNFAAYTSAPNPSFFTLVSMPQGSTTGFPTAALSTITANPDMFVVTTTSSSPSSTPSTPSSLSLSPSSLSLSPLPRSSAGVSASSTPTSAAPSQKRKSNLGLGLGLGIVGGIIFVGVVMLFSFCWGRSRGRWNSWAHVPDRNSGAERFIDTGNMYNIGPPIGVPGGRNMHPLGHNQSSNWRAVTGPVVSTLGERPSLSALPSGVRPPHRAASIATSFGGKSAAPPYEA